jgi:HEAT repeat protein
MIRKPKENRTPITAAEFLRKQEDDAELMKLKAHSKRLREDAISQRRVAEQPILDELSHAGLRYESLDALRTSGTIYRRAIPILISWLGKVESIAIKEALVRTLSVPWAKGLASEILIQEFMAGSNAADDNLRWTIGNALEVLADDGVINEIRRLALDRRYGKSREMLVIALGKFPSKENVEALRQLLSDDEMVGHAVVALGRSGDRSSIRDIEKLLDHPKDWIRAEARKALANYELR